MATNATVARIAFVLALLLAGSTTLADVIWVGGGRSKGLKQEVDVLGVEKGELVYLLYGNRVTAPLERVQQIQITDEPNFTEAETQFAAGNWEKAADAYEKVIGRNKKQWLRRRAAERLVAAADAAGQFDKAVAGYVNLTLMDPVAAVGREPRLRDGIAEDSLRRAAAAISDTVGSAREAQRKSLLSFLLQIQNRIGDEDAAGETIEKLMAILGDDRAALEASNRDRQLYAQVMLDRAKLAMNQGDTTAVRQIIDENAGLFREPRQQSDALMLRADLARRAADGSRAQLFDAALAYMKVVTYFKAEPGSPNVAAALLAVAEIHREAGEEETADQLLAEIARLYPDSEAGKLARERLPAGAE